MTTKCPTYLLLTTTCTSIAMQHRNQNVGSLTRKSVSAYTRGSKWK